MQPLPTNSIISNQELGEAILLFRVGTVPGLGFLPIIKRLSLWMRTFIMKDLELINHGNISIIRFRLESDFLKRCSWLWNGF